MAPLFFLVLVFVACSASSEARALKRVVLTPEQKLQRNFIEFESFRGKFGRKYSSPTEALERFQVFAKNLEKIDLLNEMEEGTARYGVNDMADWTEKEFLARRANLNPLKFLERMEKMNVLSYTVRDDEVPNRINWFTEGKVAPVKDQGQCGSCWAFASSGVMESANAIKTGNLTRFSEQQLVDCVPDGCNGGWMDDAFDFIKENGIETEDDYPYTGEDGECKSNNKLSVNAELTNVINIPSQDEGALGKYVGTAGPTSNAINANKLQFYKNGIIKPSFLFCSPYNQSLNHAVLLVGYDKEKNNRGKDTDYWIIKNSWGEGWGEKGFARLQRGTNTCGMANIAQGVQTK